MNHELVLLSKQIDWEEVESEFAEYYCADNGRPSVPIRTMVGVMLLKSIYNLSDEGVVARWLENPHMQYFTGEKVFQKRPPMSPIDMTKFRKRIGAQGAEKLFKISLMVNAGEITEKEMRMVMVDSTVQEKNITFPTFGSPNQSYYEKREARKKLRERAGIEPVIGLLKSDHDDAELPQVGPWGRHQCLNGYCNVQHEALDEQKCRSMLSSRSNRVEGI